MWTAPHRHWPADRSESRLFIGRAMQAANAMSLSCAELARNSVRAAATQLRLAGGLRTVVTWTLTPTKGGVLLRMEQSGFRPEEESNYKGASYGWQRYVGGLERVVAGLG